MSVKVVRPQVLKSSRYVDFVNFVLSVSAVDRRRLGLAGLLILFHKQQMVAASFKESSNVRKK